MPPKVDKRLTNSVNQGRATGPRTPQGKAISARNATKHGAYSMAILQLGESQEALDQLRSGLVSALAPEGPLEARLVDRLVAQLWRLERAQCVEQESLVMALAQARHEASDFLKKVNHEGRFDLPAPKAEEEAPAQTAFHWQEGAKLERLLRYEGQVERAFLRILHELDRIQARRLEHSRKAHGAGSEQVTPLK